MIYDYLWQLSSDELCDLFLAETKRFMDGLDNDIPHNELASIRLSVRQIMEEMDKRKQVAASKRN